MEWYVFRENINARKIEKYNIFKHGGFAADVQEMFEEDITKEDFSIRLKRIAQFFFWSKSEHETVITSWPVYIDIDELNRLNAEYEDYNNKHGHYPRLLNICPFVGKKTDIYEQLSLNWDVFVDYVWENGRKV